MIRLVKQDDLDCDRWDECIKHDPSGHFYPMHWYLDMISKYWDALVYGDYEWVMPLVHKKKWGIIPYVYRPYGVQQLGVFGKHPVTEDITKAFIKAIPKNYLHKDLYFNVENPFPNDVRHNLRRTYEIPLNQSYQSIYSGYGSQVKRNLKRAEKAGLTIFENDTPDTLVLLFQRNKGKELGLNDWHYDRIKQIMYTLIYRKMGVVWSVHDERNSPVAACFLAYTPKRMVFLFSGQEPYGMENGAMTKLIDNALMWGAERGGVFDFEGSDLPGLERFYKSFGSNMKSYAHYRR
jgi:hypothetical protein